MKTALPDGPLVAWYGDDFTGAAAVMEVLTFAGLPAVLFFDIPTAEQLAQFASCRGFGIAGVARSKSPDWMDRHLPAVFKALAALKAPINHYKVCSTFDSSPEVGSIGRAIELAESELGGDWHPMLVAAPDIARYQVFGNLFASVAGVTHRLDRHPTMSRHPVTPMDEADIAMHLGRQTSIPIGLVDILALHSNRGDAALASERARGAKIISIDTLDQASLAEAGRLTWDNRGDRLLAIGSQGVEYALAAHWRRNDLIADDHAPDAAGPADRIAVVSGSCSPVTADQITCAERQGFKPIRLDAARAVDETAWEGEIRRGTAEALAAIGHGADPIVFTASGPDDPAVEALRTAIGSSGRASDDVNARIGSGLGRILGTVVREGRIRRGVIAGGDTSSHGASTLGVYALTALAPAAPGAALCRAHTDDPQLENFEIALKGGQMGRPDYFVQVKQGGRMAA